VCEVVFPNVSTSYTHLVFELPVYSLYYIDSAKLLAGILAVCGVLICNPVTFIA